MGKRRRSQARQLTFEDTPQGRKHPGGRPRSKDSGVSHLKRQKVSKNVPMHVTTALVEGLPDLRNAACYEVFWSSFEAGCERPGRRTDGEFRVTEYSIQGNHLHLFVEASDNDALARGVQGLKTRITRGLNKLWKRTGTVWSDRYHAVLLRTPKQVRNVLNYILQNARRHGRGWRLRDKVRPDPFSSGLWFDGWANYLHDGFVAARSPVAKAKSWLARVGWRRHGLLVLPRE
jgi:hypothetical protein